MCIVQLAWLHKSTRSCSCALVYRIIGTGLDWLESFLVFLFPSRTWDERGSEGSVPFFFFFLPCCRVRELFSWCRIVPFVRTCLLKQSLISFNQKKGEKERKTISPSNEKAAHTCIKTMWSKSTVDTDLDKSPSIEPHLTFLTQLTN